MKSLYTLFIVSYFFINSTMAQKTELKYPISVKDTTSDNYFGTIVQDPYRWLEDNNTKQTQDWVNQQNTVTENYLQTIPYRKDINKRLSKMWNYERSSSYFKEGNYYYFYKNDGLQNQAVLYYKKNIKGKAKVFLDPNKLSKDGTVSLQFVNFSKDGKFAAVGTSKSGSDWITIQVIDVETKTFINDKIEWVKFSSAEWSGNGFYYSKYPKPEANSELTNSNTSQTVYYHKLGDKQEDDKIIFQDTEFTDRIYNASVTEDDRYLIISSSNGTSGNELFYKDLKKEGMPYVQLTKGFDSDFNVIGTKGDSLLILTNEDAPNYKVIAVNPKSFSKDNYQTIIKEDNILLEGAATGGGKIFTSYLKDATTSLYVYNIDGTNKKNINFKGIGTASLPYCKANQNEVFFSFSNFINAGIIYKYDILSDKIEEIERNKSKFKSEDYIVMQVFYKSSDNKNIPMFIVHHKDITLDGHNPTYLYGYGGFNVNLTPSFSVMRAAFIEQGGILAIPNLRGGGEYGENWHKAGMLENKQQVFDDFIYAAQYLIDNKYTSSNFLAIAGGSNGGLLVGACITQRPDLFKVAFPAVGVLDMLRFQKFTIGWAWVQEYGSSDNEEQFKYLYKYSPLHNIKANTEYPATLITTADHDDRVVPAHSFKFAATLQNAQKGINPTLIRISTKAGHGAGKPVSMQIDEATDVLSFMLWNMGIKELTK